MHVLHNVYVHEECVSTDRPPSLILRPDFLSRLRPELNRVLSSSRGLVRGLPLAGLNSSGDEEHE